MSSHYYYIISYIFSNTIYSNNNKGSNLLNPSLHYHPLTQYQYKEGLKSYTRIYNFILQRNNNQIREPRKVFNNNSVRTLYANEYSL